VFQQAHLTLNKKVVACRKIFIISKPNTSPLQKTQVVQFQTARKMHENIRNSTSNFYWCSEKDPWHDVFEAGGSTCKKRKVG